MVGQLVPARYEMLAAAQDAGLLGPAQPKPTLGEVQTSLASLASVAADGSGDPTGADGSRCSAGKQTHDALGAAADKLLKCGELPTKNGASARALVTVSLDNLLSGRGGGCTDHGDYLPVSVIRRLAADAGIIPVVLGG